MAINSFKDDQSFLEKLALGATGTKATISRLIKLGFRPIELERGSTGYKIWKKIKIKRVRVPDILCLKTGKRFESRAKSKLEISMSHSLKDPNRAWDSGMRSDDRVAVLVCTQQNDLPINWNIDSPIHFITIEEMRNAAKKKRVNITKPKGVEEGSEIRMIWPCKGANQDSSVTELTSNSIKLLSSTNKPQRCVLSRKNGKLIPQCKQGDNIKKNQIIASCVNIELSPESDVEVNESYYIDKLKSASLSERYASAKALRFRGYNKSLKLLKERIIDSEEDIYVQLEAAAALAAYDNTEGWDFIRKSLNSDYLTVQLETVIVLSEIAKNISEELLVEVLLDSNRDIEIRSGAAWALGEFATNKSASALINTFNLASVEIKVEAARALLKIAPSQIDLLVNAIKEVEESKRDGIAWALSRCRGFSPIDIIKDSSDNNLRKWASYIIGYGKDNFLENHITDICNKDPEVHFAASVLWQILSSWIYNLNEY